nr:uncharacterized protein LOC120973634 [Aegilops tauschii subsp. strangulata]XP_045088706.1 uncharacterized protein LOC120973634 [Aegilops tauschii subsp. strangulata]
MKQALENKDKELAMAQKEAKTKTKLVDEKLASVSKLEKEIETLKAAAAAKGESAEWEKKCTGQAAVFEQEKQTLEEKVTQLTEKKNALEGYIEEFCTEMSEKLVDTATTWSWRWRGSRGI